MQFLRGDADLRTETELTPVGEASRGVDEHRGRVDLRRPAASGSPVLGDDRLSVPGSVGAHVLQRRVDAVDDRDAHLEVEVLAVVVRVGHGKDLDPLRGERGDAHVAVQEHPGPGEVGQHPGQEVPGDVFDNIRNRIINATTKIRHRGSDYLAFALMDSIVDNYVVTIENLGNKIENLVDSMLKSQNKRLLNRVNVYRRDINSYRRTIRPVLELAIQFEKADSPLLNKKTVPFIRDLQDHIKHAKEGIEIYQELLNDELHIFHLNMGARLNDILRILTIFSVIFIPLTFIAGVYGTNFEYMPEYKYHYAYPIFWLVLILITIGMLIYFKTKKWL